jgi:hygromycin-B 7''-O-kinase
VFGIKKVLKFPLIKTEREFEQYYKSDVWLNLTAQICERHRIFHKSLKRGGGTEHIIFLVDDDLVIKIFAPFRGGFEREKKALEFARGKTSLKIPEIIATGNIEEFDYLVTTRIPGETINRNVWLTFSPNEQISVVSELANGLKELHSYDAGSLNFDWHKFVEQQSRIAVQRQIDAKVNPEWIEKLPGFIETNSKLLPADCRTVFLHGDVHFGNLHFEKSRGKWRISGLFDFADSLCGFHEFDFLAIGLLMIQGQREIQREFFRAYGYAENEINENLRKRLMLMTVLYECSDLSRYAVRLKPEAVNFTFEELERAIWSFVE